MKENIKIIIVFILGIIISVVISTFTYIKIRPDKKASYTDKKELKSTSDPDYISGVYSSSSTIGSSITNLKTYTLLSSTKTTAPSTSGSYTYQSVSNMNKYMFITVRLIVAYQNVNLVFVNGDTAARRVYDIDGNSYKIRGLVYCDWTNNRIYVAYDYATGWTNSVVYIDRVYGVVIK